METVFCRRNEEQESGRKTDESGIGRKNENEVTGRKTESGFGRNTGEPVSGRKTEKPVSSRKNEERHLDVRMSIPYARRRELPSLFVSYCQCNGIQKLNSRLGREHDYRTFCLLGV